MAFPDDNEPPRKTRGVSNSTIGLVIGGAILALIGLSWFYSGRSLPTTGENAPNTPTQSQPQR
jgi:hypothetical protein